MGQCIQKRMGEVTALEMQCGFGRKTIVTVYCYLIDGLLIDTGPRRMHRAIGNTLEEVTINRVLLTHHHEDHSGNAAGIHRRWQIPVHGHPDARRKLANGYSILPYQHVLFGSAEPVPVEALPSVIESDHLKLTPLHTPGHSKDHTVYFEKQKGWLFSGDLYVGSRIKFFRADEDFSQTMRALRSVAALDFDTLYCAHNPHIKGGKQCIREKLAFFEDLLGEIGFLRNHHGMTEADVIRSMTHLENRMIKWFTFGNASFAHMIRSAWRALPPTDRLKDGT